MNSTLLYLAPRYRAPLKLTELDAIQPWLGPDVSRDVAFLVSPRKQHLVGVIQKRYPQAELDERRSATGQRLLTVLRVPALEVRGVEDALRNAQAK